MNESLQDITHIKDIKGKKILIRSSLNVPITKEGILLNEFRLDKTLHSIKYLRDYGAKIIVVGHLGRDEHISIKPVYNYLKNHISIDFVDDIVGEKAKEKIEKMGDGDVLLLENLRRNKGEVENSEEFAKELASLADIYVNDCFSTSHREHASIVGVPKFLPSYIGLLFKDELENLEIARNPEHPALFILGGAKFATKQPLVEKFLDVYDHVFVTGALANDFFKAQGFEMGKSIVSEPAVNVDDLLSNPKIILPKDVVVLTENGQSVVKNPNELNETDMINDSGPSTQMLLEPIIQKAKFILWNGPIGDYQLGFIEGTKEIITMIANSNAKSVVGGGDTMALISRFGFDKVFTFGSTAGGAMLEFLLNGTLPAIKAIEEGKK